MEPKRKEEKRLPLNREEELKLKGEDGTASPLKYSNTLDTPRREIKKEAEW